MALRNAPLPVYHLQSPTPPTAEEAARTVVPDLQLLPDEDFERLLTQAPVDVDGNLLAPLLDLWNQLKTAPATITVSNALTMAQLERIGFQSPIPGPDRLLRAFQFPADERIRKEGEQA